MKQTEEQHAQVVDQQRKGLQSGDRPLSLIYCHDNPILWLPHYELRPWLTKEDIEWLESLPFDWGDVMSYTSTWMDMEDVECVCEATHDDMIRYCALMFRKNWDLAYRMLICIATDEFDKTVRKFAGDGHSVALGIAERRARAKQTGKSVSKGIKIVVSDIGSDDGDEED